VKLNGRLNEWPSIRARVPELRAEPFDAYARESGKFVPVAQRIEDKVQCTA